PLQHIFFVFDEFNFDVELARRLLNLGLEKQIVHEGEDAQSSVLVGRKRLRIGGSIRWSKSGTPAPTARAFVSRRAAIIVVHGSGVNAAHLLTIAAAVLASAIRRATSAPPSASPA